MNSDHSKKDSTTDNSNQNKDGITRRDMLEGTAKTIAGLTVGSVFFVSGKNVKAAPGSKAYNPSPYQGQLNIEPNTVLTWSPGKNTISHDVYFGTSWDDVYNGTGGTFMGS